MSLSLDQLSACYPKATSQNLSRFIEPLNGAIEKYQINTPQRLAMFLAQAGHESAQLNATVENLNYSAKALLTVFPKYFDTKSATLCEHRPETIANIVYANRMGNGPSENGDGWKFRGRGIFQHTGKNEYIRLSGSLGIDLVAQPELLEGPVFATLGAGDFWKLHVFNAVADKPASWTTVYKGITYDPFKWVTFRINGGLNGLDDRLALWKNAKHALGI